MFMNLSLSVQELYSLMFSLDWVSTKARIMGPAQLISDYVEYGHILDKEVRIQAELAIKSVIYATKCLLFLSEQRRPQSVPGVLVSQRPPPGAASVPRRGPARSVPAPRVRCVQTGPAAGTGTDRHRETLLRLAV